MTTLQGVEAVPPALVSMQRLAIAASICCADQLHLGDVVQTLERGGIDMVHVDIMDGHFVPNFALGFDTLAALCRATALPTDVHLMVADPERFLARIGELGATDVTVHIEACPRPFHVLRRIRSLGMRAGLAFNPATALTSLPELLPELDRIVVMGVDPGFTGQPYITSSTRRIARVARLRHAARSGADIQVDGGVRFSNLADLSEAGATTVVVGTATLFNPGADLGEQALRLRAICDEPRAANAAAGLARTQA